MTLRDYEIAAQSTRTGATLGDARVIYPTLGLTGESGEVADKVKKVIRDNGGNFTDELKHGIALELGDVLWYVTSLANDLGYSLEEIAQMNIEKLFSRKERGTLNGSGDER